MKFARMIGSACLAAITMVGSTALSFGDATVPTKDISAAQDHPLVKRYDGSFIVSYEQLAFTDLVIPLSPLKASADPDARDTHNNRVYAADETLELEGALTRITYVLPEGRSPLEVLRNYQDVVEAAGGTVLFECKKEECGGDATRATSGGGGKMSLAMHFLIEDDIKDADFSNGKCALTSSISDQRYFAAKVPEAGGDAHVTVQTFALAPNQYCKALNNRTIALVHVLEAKARDKKMVLVEAAEMADTLSSTGSISLYGIYFDTNKATLQPESEPTLREIATLLANDPKMAVLVVGHTDNQGRFDYNVDLSSRRAKAVSTALTSQYGVSAKRLTFAGAGMMAPVASNDSEEGRAKNRRVVLVKAN
jgi:OOP family OmpA-OmpF porin